MNKKSFTLIELLVVIAIIGILSSLVIARFSNWSDEARIANTLQWSAGVHRTLGANLVGHWPLDGSANDISGHGNNGTMHNFEGEPDDYWVDGVPGTGNQSLKYDGSDDGLVINYNNNLDFTGASPSPFTFSAWVYPYVLVGKDRAIINQSHSIYFEWSGGDNKWMLGTYNNAWTARAISNQVDTKIDEWKHIVGTNNGTQLHLYINGLAQQPVTVGAADDNKSPINIGSQLSGGYRNFNGLISDVRIYDTALTAEEVSRIYAESKDKYLVDLD